MPIERGDWPQCSDTDFESLPPWIKSQANKSKESYYWRADILLLIRISKGILREVRRESNPEIRLSLLPLLEPLMTSLVETANICALLGDLRWGQSSQSQPTPALGSALTLVYLYYHLPMLGAPTPTGVDVAEDTAADNGKPAVSYHRTHVSRVGTRVGLSLCGWVDDGRVVVRMDCMFVVTILDLLQVFNGAPLLCHMATVENPANNCVSGCGD